MGECLHFGEALRLLKSGYKVSRSGWNGKGMFLFFVLPVGTPQDKFSHFVDYAMRGTDFSGVDHIKPFIAMKTADNGIVPWTASQTDILAVDWDIVP